MLQEIEIGVAGVLRRVIVERPADLQPGAPLVVMHHGAYQTPETIRRRSGLGQQLANSHGAVVAFPAGWMRTWNADWQDGRDAGGDVALFDEIVREARERWGIDPLRVVVAGFSNGGMFSLRLGCERAEQLAGVVTSCSSMRRSLAQCTPARPVPIFLRHGRFDPVVHPVRPHRSPIGRIIGGRYMEGVLPAVETTEFWERVNGTEAPVRLHVQTAGHKWLPASTQDVRDALDLASVGQSAVLGDGRPAASG